MLLPLLQPYGIRDTDWFLLHSRWPLGRCSTSRRKREDIDNGVRRRRLGGRKDLSLLSEKGGCRPYSTEDNNQAGETRSCRPRHHPPTVPHR